MPLEIVRKKWVLRASKSLGTVYTPGHKESLEKKKMGAPCIKKLKDGLHTRPLGIVRKKWVLRASKILRTVYT